MRDTFFASILVVTPLLIFLVWCLQFYVRRSRLRKLAAEFDGPPSLPLIGNVLNAVAPLDEVTQNILDGCTRYKSPTRLWFGPCLSVQIYDPENAQIVLRSPDALEKEPYLYKLFETATGNGLLTLPVQEWKRHRKLMVPIFNQRFFRRCFDVFTRHSKKFVQNLEAEIDRGYFDVHKYALEYSLDSIMEALLDFTDDNKISFDTHSLLDWLQSIWEGMATRITSIWYYPDSIFKMSKIGKKTRTAKTNYDAYLATCIKKWRADSEKELNSSSESLKPMSLMDHMLSTSPDNEKFTNEELHGEISNLLIAGFETTSSTMGYALLFLGIYQDIQEKAFREITEVLGNKPQLEYDDLHKLDYLERIIKESLRLVPGLTGLARYSTKEIQLTNHTIPAYTSIIIVLIALHRDPTIWPNPLKFDPDRFLPEEEAKRHPYSWIPFSGGPRNCLAPKFAYITLKTSLSAFLLKYKVETDYKSVEDIRLTMMTVLKPTNGYRITVKPR